MVRYLAVLIYFTMVSSQRSGSNNLFKDKSKYKVLILIYRRDVSKVKMLKSFICDRDQISSAKWQINDLNTAYIPKNWLSLHKKG